MLVGSWERGKPRNVWRRRWGEFLTSDWKRKTSTTKTTETQRFIFPVSRHRSFLKAYANLESSQRSISCREYCVRAGTEHVWDVTGTVVTASSVDDIVPAVRTEISAGHWCQRPGPKIRGQGTGNRERRAEHREQGTGDREQRRKPTAAAVRREAERQNKGA